jgi:hypothetical protein
MFTASMGALLCANFAALNPRWLDLVDPLALAHALHPVMMKIVRYPEKENPNADLHVNPFPLDAV